TTDGKYFYVVSSSNRDAENRFGLLRLDFDPSTTQATVSPIPDFRKRLFERVAELKGLESRTVEEDGLNIEGIAWDAAGTRLFVGWRSPLWGNQEMLTRTGVGVPAAAFTLDNLAIGEAPTIKLSLDGLGVRCIEYDSKLKSFLIIAGVTEAQRKGEF